MTGKPSQLGPYSLQELLGYNGLFSSYQGIDHKTQLPALVVAVARDEITDPAVWEVFTHDFDSLASAAGGHLCRAYHFGEDQGHYWAAFEWLEGRHMGLLVRDDGLPDYASTFEWMAQLADALAALHRRGIVHRCISPASIFITKRGDLRLLHCAWSLLLLYTQTGLASPSLASVLPFVAPEILNGETGDEGADVYSLGANLYFLVTGQPVFWHDDPAELARLAIEEPPNMAIVPRELPDEARDLIEELLAKTPDARPLNLPALADKLMAIARLFPGGQEAPKEPSSYGVMAHDVGSPDGEPDIPRGDEETERRLGMPPPSPYQPPEPTPDPRTPIEEPPPGRSLAQQVPQEQLTQEATYRRAEEQHHAPAGAQGVPGADVFPEPAPAKKRPKILVLALVGVVALAVVGIAAMTFLGGVNGGSATPGRDKVAEEAEPTPEELAAAAAAREETRRRNEQLLLERYRETSRRLRAVGAMMIVYQRERGIGEDDWPRRIEDLEELGDPEEFKDAWERRMEVRGSFVVSAGADGRFDTDDDVWFDAATGRPGGYSPTLARNR